MVMAEEEHGRWHGDEFCPLGGKTPIDGCYYCGRAVAPGPHDHTMVEKKGYRGATEDRYSCVCVSC